MIYANTWNLTGSENQQQIVREALDKIKFPWDRLNLPNEPTEIGWRDLNDGSILAAPASEGHHHEGERHHGEGDKPEPLFGEIKFGKDQQARKMILGVFYPGTGRIYVDTRLEQRPAVAQSTVSAEVAHAVDEFLPLTDQQRTEIMALVHPFGPDEHTWWEKQDYSAEYFSLVGETFMILFTYAYSDLPFESASSFVHAGDPKMGDDIRRIMAIERTDSAAERLHGLRGYKTYHKPKHYLSRWKAKPTMAPRILDFEDRTKAEAEGYRACRRCFKT